MTDKITCRPLANYQLETVEASDTVDVSDKEKMEKRLR
jgi:hypothetical protein